MKLYFVRHTTAADFAVSDARRPLTQQGEEEARTVGMALAGMGVRPTRVFSSPLHRARQTGAIIAKQLGFVGRIEALDQLANGTSTASLLKALPVAHAGDELVLVGHMPSLADHLAKILDSDEAADLSFGKGSVACVEMDKHKVHSGKLHWMKHLYDFS